MLQGDAGEDRGFARCVGEGAFLRRVEEDFGEASIGEAAGGRSPAPALMFECHNVSGATAREVFAGHREPSRRVTR